eukprot:3098351-Karenia_brevis.AAC.1
MLGTGGKSVGLFIMYGLVSQTRELLQITPVIRVKGMTLGPGDGATTGPPSLHNMIEYMP